MRIDYEKYLMSRARACVSQRDFEKNGVPRTTLYRALHGNAKPETVGKIAKVLNVDVSEIVE